jgi:hypothetical protein
MPWQLMVLLAALAGAPQAASQTGSQAEPQAGQQGASSHRGQMVVTPPDDRTWSRCMSRLGADGAVNSELTVRCQSVRNGQPQDCQLETGHDFPVRHRQAARCLAPHFRYAYADGEPADSGPVTIPIRLSVSVRTYY